MEANKVKDSHRPPTDGGMAREEFIRVGTTLYKIVEQPRLNGGYVRKRIAWNNETLRQDYGKDYIGSVPKYDGFCTVPEHVGYKPVVGKFLNLYEPIDHKPIEGDFPSIRTKEPFSEAPFLLPVRRKRGKPTVYHHFAKASSDSPNRKRKAVRGKLAGARKGTEPKNGPFSEVCSRIQIQCIVFLRFTP